MHSAPLRLGILLLLLLTGRCTRVTTSSIGTAPAAQHYFLHLFLLVRLEK